MRRTDRSREWRRRTRLIACAVVLACGAVAAGVAAHKTSYFNRRFAEVTPGALFRSSQPRGDQWARVADHGVRTVVDLRPAEENPEDFADSERGCRRYGLTFVNIPIGADGPTDADLAAFFHVCAREERRPILVHCEHGRRRTGLFVGLYGVVFEHWSEKQAFETVRKIYQKPLDPAYAAILRRVLRHRDEWAAGRFDTHQASL